MQTDRPGTGSGPDDTHLSLVGESALPAARVAAPALPRHTVGVRQPKPHAHHLWMLLGVVVLAVTVPILVVADTPDVGRSSAWLITLAICCWAGLRMSWIVAAKPTSLYEFMFWLFTYIFLGLAPTVQIRTGELSSTTPGVSPAFDMRTALAVAVSLGVFEIGRLCYRQSRHPLPAARSATRLGWGVWVLFGIGLLCTAFYLSRVGVGVLFQSREAREASRGEGFADSSVAAIFSALSWIPLLIAGGACAWARRERRSRGLSGRYGPAALIACLVVLILVNPISGARYTSGTVLFAFLCYAGLFIGTRRARAGLVGIVLAFLFLFPIADAFRRNVVRVSRAGFFTEYAGNPDYDSFWQIANAISYVMRNGVVWGRQALGVVVFWVPRSIWPDKPTDTGVLLANFRGYRVTNLSAPLWAESYINGGLLVVVLVFLVLGLVLKRLDVSLPRAFSGGGRLALLGSFVPAYMLILLRGSLLQATGAFWVMLVAVFIAGLGAHTTSSATSARPDTPSEHDPPSRLGTRPAPSGSATADEGPVGDWTRRSTAGPGHSPGT